MKFLLLACLQIVFLFPAETWAQKTAVTDTTNAIYNALPTLKTYSVSSSACKCGDSSWFKIDDKIVNENTYRKFGQSIGAYDECKPCIMLSFDTSERLHHKWIAYSECRVGYWIEYYPTGEVKVIGHYKENGTGNWDNLLERDYCREDGVWTYFSNRGRVIRSEVWKEGKLIKKKVH